MKPAAPNSPPMSAENNVKPTFGFDPSRDGDLLTTNTRQTALEAPIKGINSDRSDTLSEEASRRRASGLSREKTSTMCAYTVLGAVVMVALLTTVLFLHWNGTVEWFPSLAQAFQQ
ncbi:hypothetical protein V3C99_003036 [Haemonchus contortus]|uniref:Transmembrane protein n=1 Tax=Haemonchus contortus TaxID=6289 RepID=A0A7I4Z608_HAECO